MVRGSSGEETDGEELISGFADCKPFNSSEGLLLLKDEVFNTGFWEMYLNVLQ